MHSFELIPLVAVLFSAAFGAVSLSWNSDRRATGTMSSIFLCIGFWGLFDLLSQLESDPARAAVWIRWIPVPMLILGPLVIRLVGQIMPGLGDRMRPLARAGFALAIGLGMISVGMPGAVESATPTSWGGWMPHYGAVMIALMPLGCVLPVAATYHAMRTPVEGLPRVNATRARALPTVVALSLGVTLGTEFFLPQMGFPVPRLGAIVSGFGAALTWLRVLYVADDLALTPRGTARSVLTDLHDGVALVQLDGLVVSSNARLAELSGYRSAEMMGEPLENLLDTPLCAVRDGVEDREALLRTRSGEALPVSVSSSLRLDDRGGVAAVVVVLRDLRKVEALRRRLISSGRLAAIGELAAGIAHEVNNPVAFIRSDLNFLGRRLSEIHDKALAEAVDEGDLEIFSCGPARLASALAGIERVAEVVGDVRGFAHVGATGPSEESPALLLEGAMRLARLERGPEVVLCVKDELPEEPVMAGQELKQVFLALLRVLTLGSAPGASVEVSCGSEALSGMLSLRLRAPKMVDAAANHVERFEALRSEAFDTGRGELGLAIAAELVDEVFGSLRFEAVGDRDLAIALQWPLAADDGGAIE